MSGLGKTVVRKLSGKEVICRELSVEAVRKLLQPSAGSDLLDEMLFEDFRLIDIPLFTGLTSEDIAKALPSELDPIIEGCKEANPHFFGMLARYNNLRKTV